MKKIEDYLHLYLGCELMSKAIEEKVGVLIGVVEKYIYFKINNILYSNHAQNYKPILRPLSDMTEEEKIMICCLNLTNEWHPGHIIQTNDDDIAAMRVFDHRGNYKTLYIPKNRISPLNFLWLLSKHFDLFGLIESGLALDKTTLNQTT